MICKVCYRAKCTCPRRAFGAGGALLLVAFASCSQPTPPHSSPSPEIPLPDGSSVVLDEYELACEQMSTLDCAAGRSPYCADAMRRSPAELGITFDAACIARSTSKADVRACAPVDCP